MEWTALGVWLVRTGLACRVAWMEPIGVLGSQKDVRNATRDASTEHDRAVRLAWLLTGSQAAAEDVVQDAMTGVYRLFDQLQSPGAYLHRAVVNRARSRSRDERRQQERVARLIHEHAATDPDDAGLLELIGRQPSACAMSASDHPAQ
jgi:DNA-directed RNA polymerase specialized sigma24 family protein